jgi:outer membrane protein
MKNAESQDSNAGAQPHSHRAFRHAPDDRALQMRQLRRPFFPRLINLRCSAVGHLGFFLLTFALVITHPATAATLTLDDAIRLALQNNQTLKVSAFTPEIARANVLAEYGRFDPAFTFRRSYSEGEAPVNTTPLIRTLTQNDDYALSLGGLTPWGASYGLTATADNQRGTFNSFSDHFVTFGGITVTQPFLRGFGFGANLAGLRVAKADRGIADWQHRQSVIDIVTSVVVVYSSVLQAREGVRIAQLSRDLTARLVQQNETRNRIGQFSDADVLQARARLAGREENVLIAQRTAADFENQLRQLTGETHFPIDGPSLELEPPPRGPQFTVEAAADLKRAFELRPDYQAALLGITRQKATTALAQNQLLPRVDFVGSYGYSGMDRDFSAARRQVRNQDVRAYSAGIVVSVPIAFTEGRGRLRSAKLSLRQFEADLLRLEQDIAVDVAAAAGQIETVRRRVIATSDALDLAQKSLDAEQKKFTAGTSSTFLVLQAQEQLAQAQSSHARALAEQRRAFANYEREIGTTLFNRNITVE